MKKFSNLSKAAFLVAISFGVNKILAIVRQLIIARQFGLTSDLDVFNVANNVPDMIYALISGGALAVAIIPVMTEVMTLKDRDAAWKVFSQIANFAFLVTIALSVLTAVFAWPLVQSPIGKAPGFDLEQQALVVRLMRLNLVATLIFSMAGLLIAGLQANQHFLLPAIGPILYNIGQIYGAVVMAPDVPYTFGPVTLPAMGMGVDGLVYGVIIGAVLFFVIQIPGLIMFKFKWSPRINLRHPDVNKIMVMLGPRVLGMFFYQMTFFARDNIASRLPVGSVSALTYGWMILQLPETLIGTAIGTALLPTISEHIARKDLEEFNLTINRVIRVLIALSVPAAILLSFSLTPFLDFAFGFESAETDLMLRVTRAFLVGLLSHCLLELAARIFFARQDAVRPLIASGLNLAAYVISGAILAGPLQAVGLGLADAIAFTVQAFFLLIVYRLGMTARMEGESKAGHSARSLFGQKSTWGTLLRTLAGSAAGTAAILLVMRTGSGFLPNLMLGLAAAGAGALITFPFILKEFRILLRL